MNKELLDHNLFGDIQTLIRQSKEQVAVAVNSAMSMLYWQIGKRINNEVLQNTRAEYGKQVIVSLSRQLTLEYGKGWSEKNLRHMMRFAEVFLMNKLSYH